MARSILGKAVDSVKDTLLAKEFQAGAKYEMLKPVAVQYIEQMGVTFDLPDYSFVISGFGGGMVWTKDVAYGKNNPPPPHPTLGVPLAPQVLPFIRLATDE